MQDVSSGEGKTVLFVSHDMNVISTLTKNALLLRQGKIVKIGKTRETITEYLSDEKTKELTYKDEPSDDCPKVIYVQLFTSLPNNFHINGQQLSIKIILNTPFPVKNACISIQFYDSMGRNYVHIWNLSEVPFCYEKGNFELLAIIPKLRLYMGEYYLRIHLSEPQGGNKFQTIENICPFTVVMYEISRSFVWVANTCAYIEDCIWKVDKL
jgi:lipopolysaccharide transport system ATP-binding protein